MNLYLKVKDPSGETRVLKITELPFRLGTQYENPTALRDEKISSEALVIEDRNGLILKSTQDDLMIRMGDLQFPSIQVQMGLPLRVGETEISFFDKDPKRHKKNLHWLESPWVTVDESGQQLLKDLKKASTTDLSVYLFGETGTGKELLAKQVHDWSSRNSGPFVAINCGALSVSLAESELFGHVKGSFTGAYRDRPGALIQAHCGTLFLDEVADLPMDIQVKLLRFLESGEIRPVGSDRVVFANVRVICATHKSLLKLIEEGKFRQDLYYRLASVPVEITPLRDRPNDIRTLAAKYALENQKYITDAAMRRLQCYSWIGNVRELKHAVDRACGIAGPFEEVLHHSHFDFLAENSPVNVELRDVGVAGICTFEDMEKIMILRALRVSNGNRSEAARILNVARSTIFEMIKRHRIVGPRSGKKRVALETS